MDYLFTTGTHVDVMTYLYIRTVKNEAHSTAVLSSLRCRISGIKYYCKILVVIPITDPAFPLIFLINAVRFSVYFYDLSRCSSQSIPANTCGRVIIMDNMG